MTNMIGVSDDRNTFRMKGLLANIVSFKSERKQSIDKKTDVVSVVAFNGENPCLM